MIQTIHLINVAEKKKKILVTANIEFDTLQSQPTRILNNRA